ncbi:hypothetical protein KO317_00820 [Candidatus Micrarchaeota archaeon]|nr:hypothetical protein [Candidatus Micrarchaeota archaeon]
MKLPLKNPSLPILAVIIFSFLFLLLTINSFLGYTPQKIELNSYLIEEKNLEKINIQIKANETYLYKINLFDDIFNITYFITEEEGQICIIEYLFEQPTIICINEKGNEIYPFPQNSNITYSQPIFFFSPWMLAIHDNWTWNSKSVVEFKNNQGIEIKDSNLLSFKTMQRENIFGRDAYKIEITEGTRKEYYWIDKEKRILLKKEGVENIILINGPFKIVQQQVE